MNQPAEEQTSSRSWGQKAVAILVLLVAAWILLHFLVHIAVAIVSVVVIVAAIVALVWALRVVL